MSIKRRGLLIYLAVLIIAAAAAVLRISSSEEPFRTDIYGMVPGLPDPAEEEFTRRIAGETVFLAEGRDLKSVLESAGELRDLIQRSGAVELRSEDPASAASFVFSHRYSYAPPAEVHNGGLSQYILETLYSPFSAVSGGEIRKDPFFASRNAASYLGSDWSMSDGGLPYRKSGKEYAVLLEGRSSGKGYLGIHDLEAFRERAAAKQVKVSCTGAMFFSERYAERSKRDVGVIGTGSMIIVLILQMWIFRRIVPVIHTVIALTVSLCAGIAAVIIVSGSVHVMTLALSSCLVGICFDYVLHSLLYFKRAGNGGNGILPRVMVISLAESLLTSVIAYAAMLMTDLRVLWELMIFAIAALCAVFFYAVLVIPTVRFPAPREESVPGIPAVPRLIRLAVPLSVAALGLILIPSVSFNDDVGAMQKADPGLMEMHEHIEETVSGGKRAKWFVMGRSSCESLAGALSADELRGTLLPCRAVPSERQQLLNIRQWKALLPALVSAYKQAGIEIRPEDAGLEKASPFKAEEFPGGAARFFYGDEVLVKAGSGDAALIRKISSVPGARAVDSRAHWSEAFRMYRESLLLVLGAAFILALVPASVIMRRRMVMGFVIPMLAGLGLALAAGLAAGYLNLFTVLALFMVMGLGADYCIFLHNSPGDGYVLRSVGASWLTTEISFGLLAFSDTAVLSSYGLVLAAGLAGVALSAVLAFSGRREERPGQDGLTALK
ncbi:MAG: hypothetical protein SOW06_05105 [Succinivibrionaceae bacterium]|nr:hypothetical protein [Pseudomonadota bacterium]MDY3144729.1 hypothetical protein [Succinivibrionaceae bacterium]